jgi:hypothetical protein
MSISAPPVRRQGEQANNNFCASAREVWPMEIGLLALHVVGLTFAAQGAQKLFGAFGGPRIEDIGFGIWTMQPIRESRSRSFTGQGMGARWRRFRVRGAGG